MPRRSNVDGQIIGIADDADADRPVPGRGAESRREATDSRQARCSRSTRRAQLVHDKFGKYALGKGSRSARRCAALRARRHADRVQGLRPHQLRPRHRRARSDAGRGSRLQPVDRTTAFLFILTSIGPAVRAGPFVLGCRDDVDIDRHRRRRHRGARARPDAPPQLAALAAPSPTSRALERATRASLAPLGLTTGRRAWLAAPDDGAQSTPTCAGSTPPGVTLLAATSPTLPGAAARSRRTRPPCSTCAATRRCSSEPQLAMVGSRNPTAGGARHGARLRGVVRARRPHHHQRTRARHRRRLP